MVGRADGRRESKEGFRRWHLGWDPDDTKSMIMSAPRGRAFQGERRARASRWKLVLNARCLGSIPVEIPEDQGSVEVWHSEEQCGPQIQAWKSSVCQKHEDEDHKDWGEGPGGNPRCINIWRLSVKEMKEGNQQDRRKHESENFRERLSSEGCQAAKRASGVRTQKSRWHFAPESCFARRGSGEWLEKPDCGELGEWTWGNSRVYTVLLGSWL